MSSDVADFIAAVEDNCDTPEAAMAELRAAALLITEELGRLERVVFAALTAPEGEA